MSEIALDKIEARGEARGLALGERKVIERALMKGSTPELIAEITDMPIKKVLEIQANMLQEVE